MKDRAKTLWLEALRSGVYPQGKGELHRSPEDGVHAFCGLGVLCDLAVLDGVDVTVDHNEAGLYFYDGLDTQLPNSVMEWAGLVTHCGQLPGTTDPIHTLSHLNDSGYSFERIANLIEERF